LKTIIRLTKTDFREGELEFEDNVIRKK
jgi:hypothetical protein